jgi:hypothetical protein
MAEFGERATQLSPPQGAGAAPVGPATTGVLDNGVIKGIASIADIFEKGLQASAKEKALAAQQAVVGGYARKLQSLNDAATTGQLKPSEVAARQRALHSEYVGSYAQYVDELDKVKKSFQGTEIGAAEEKLKTEQELRKERISSAQKDGFPIVEGMDEKTINMMVEAHQADIRVNEEFQRTVRRNKEQRDAGRWSNEVSDRELKDKSIVLLNDVVNTYVDTSLTYAADIGNRLRSGTIDANMAAAEWATYATKIEAQLQAVAGRNPELAGSYRSLFNDIRNVGTKFLDPTSDLKQVEDQEKLIIARKKLIQLNDPAMANLVASSQLLGSNADLALRGSGIVTKVLANLGSKSVDSPGQKDQLVGNPEVEKNAFEVLKGGISKLNSGAYTDEPKAKQEIANTINNALSQVGDALGRPGTDPKFLNAVADFVASPQYAKFASENKLDARSISLAEKTFSIAYNDPLIKAVEQKITEAFTVKPGLVPNRAATGETLQPTEKTFDKSNLKAQFSGSGIYFDLKEIPVNPQERRNAEQVLLTLRDSEKVVNKLLRIGAHLEGSTNYDKYWNDNKHILLPSLFSKYEGLEIGDVVDNQIYLGGNVNDANNWRERNPS